MREPHIYVTTTLKQIEERCEENAKRLGLSQSCYRSNHEGELVDLIQQARQSADAIKVYEGVVVEVHISNIHARDELHRHSKISSAVTAVICGLGPHGTIAAMDAVAQMKTKR